MRFYRYSQTGRPDLDAQVCLKRKGVRVCRFVSGGELEDHYRSSHLARPAERPRKRRGREVQLRFRFLWVTWSPGCDVLLSRHSSQDKRKPWVPPSVMTWRNRNHLFVLRFFRRLLSFYSASTRFLVVDPVTVTGRHGSRIWFVGQLAYGGIPPHLDDDPVFSCRYCFKSSLGHEKSVLRNEWKTQHIDEGQQVGQSQCKAVEAIRLSHRPV